jgi:uncharacterized protein (TIGR03435 family)
MRSVIPALVTVLATSLSAQDTVAPRFEVSSVRANTSNPPMQVLPTLQPGGRVFAINLPLREFIRVAYGLRDNQLIVSSPLAETRFDLEARAGASTTHEQAVMMLRALLTERFGLKTHPETRQLPIYTLERVNAERLGPSLKPAPAECAQLTFPAGPGAPPPPPPPPAALAGTPLGPKELWAECPSMFFPGGWSLRSMTMHAFAFALERLIHRPVNDESGLQGLFNIDITYAPDTALDTGPFPAGVVGGPVGGPDAGGPPPAQRTGPSLFSALRDQLGLRLEGGRAPVDVLVVDHVQPPTEN